MIFEVAERAIVARPAELLRSAVSLPYPAAVVAGVEAEKLAMVQSFADLIASHLSAGVDQEVEEHPGVESERRS